MRGPGALFPVLLACAACGSRTGFDIAAPATQDAGADAVAAIPEAGIDASAPDSGGSVSDASIAPDAVVVVDAGCTAALQPGSPAPISGYCPTQANVAPTRVPTSPQILWSTQLDANYAPSEMVVDPDGRAYLASCSVPQDGDSVACDDIVAVDPDGAVAWSHAFDSGVGGLFLDPQGTLHVESGVPRTLYTLDAAGDATTLATLPANVTYSYVGADGDLYGTSVDYDGTTADAIVKMTAGGEVLWSTPLACNDCVAYTALGPDDSTAVALIVPDGDGGLNGSVVKVDAAGSVAWARVTDGFAAEPMAIARDGSIRIVLWTEYMSSSSSTVLASLSPAGNVLWQTDVHQDPEQTGDDPLVVLEDGTTIFRSFVDLDAVDASGNLRWSSKLSCPNCAYYAAADPQGGLVALLDGIEGIDVGTGNVLWSGIAAPQEGGTLYFGSSMVLGPPGVIFGATFGGEIFAAYGPSQ